MSDRIYSTPEPVSSENLLTVAQSCRGVLAKRFFPDREPQSYDHVKFFNFYEINIWSLDELYTWSKRLLTKPKCCLIRARIKNLNNCRHVLRRAVDRGDGLVTLIPYRCYWFALDIDGYGVSRGDLYSDAWSVLLALPSCFQDVECFAVASASYGIKPSIHMRLFFWSQEPVSNNDILRMLRGNKANADLAIYQNPVQPIYTAAPIFAPGMIDPVKQRIVWINGKSLTVNIRSESPHVYGAKEAVYTYDEARAFARKTYRRISDFTQGERHNELYKASVFLGKLVGQEHFEREEVIDRAFNCCNFWYGKRDTDKDMKTIIAGVDFGIAAMDRS